MARTGRYGACTGPGQSLGQGRGGGAVLRLVLNRVLNWVLNWVLHWILDLASDSGSGLGFWNLDFNPLLDDKATRSYEDPFDSLRIDWIGWDSPVTGSLGASLQHGTRNLRLWPGQASNNLVATILTF